MATEEFTLKKKKKKKNSVYDLASDLGARFRMIRHVLL